VLNNKSPTQRNLSDRLYTYGDRERRHNENGSDCASRWIEFTLIEIHVSHLQSIRYPKHSAISPCCIYYAFHAKDVCFVLHTLCTADQDQETKRVDSKTLLLQLRAASSIIRIHETREHWSFIPRAQPLAAPVDNINILQPIVDYTNQPFTHVYPISRWSLRSSRHGIIPSNILSGTVIWHCWRPEHRASASGRTSLKHPTCP